MVALGPLVGGECLRLCVQSGVNSKVIRLSALIRLVLCFLVWDSNPQPLDLQAKSLPTAPQSRLLMFDPEWVQLAMWVHHNRSMGNFMYMRGFRAHGNQLVVGAGLPAGQLRSVLFAQLE